MNMHVRSRRAPDPMWQHYQEFAYRMRDDEIYRSKMRDKVAYIYVTGQFPSHLRDESKQALRHMVSHAPKGTSLDERNGMVRVTGEVVSDLELNAHPMVQKVRQKMSEGYLIQPSRGFGSRRNYWKIFMFKFNVEGIAVSPITVKGDAAIKEGW